MQRRVEFREQDLFKTDLSKATVVTLYLLPEVNLQLRPALLALAPGTRIVSHDWDMGDWQPDRTVTVAAPDKTIGREKLSRLHLWVVPARIEGRWCAVGSSGGAVSLRFMQSHQQWRATVERGRSTNEIEGVIDGIAVRSTRSGAAELRHEARRAGAAGHPRARRDVVAPASPLRAQRRLAMRQELNFDASR